MRPFRNLADLPWRLWRDCSGNYSLIVVLLLPVLTGFVGLGTEAGLWFFTHQTMQGAADAAAISAARVAISGGNWQQEALGVAAARGFTNGSNDTGVVALSPPQAGSHIGLANYYEVFISQQQKRLFSALLISTPVNITARAVATVSSSGGADACLVALDQTAAGAIQASGTSTQLNLGNCDLYDDFAASGSTTNSAALVLTGQAAITAPQGFVVGTADAANFNGTLFTGAASLADPFKTTAVPNPQGCTASNFSMNGGQQTINPGTYCGGFDLKAGAELDLNPGVYVLNQGSLTMSGQGQGNSLWCPPKANWNTTVSPPTIDPASVASPGGCTIVLATSAGPTTCATVNIAGNSNVNIIAPSSGPTKGFAFMSSYSCSVGSPGSQNGASTASFNGGAGVNVIGTVYLPTYSITYHGGSTTDTSNQCTQIIGDTVAFAGNSGLGNNCSGFAGHFATFGNTAVLAE